VKIIVHSNSFGNGDQSKSSSDMASLGWRAQRTYFSLPHILQPKTCTETINVVLDAMYEFWCNLSQNWARYSKWPKEGALTIGNTLLLALGGDSNISTVSPSPILLLSCLTSADILGWTYKLAAHWALTQKKLNQQKLGITYICQQSTQDSVSASALHKRRGSPHSSIIKTSTYHWTISRIYTFAMAATPISTTSNLQYSTGPEGGVRAYQHVNADPLTGERRRNVRREEKPVVIENIRGKEDSVSLDTAGFQFYKHTSKHTTFANDEEIYREYYPESIELIKKLTGASRVELFDYSNYTHTWSCPLRSNGLCY